MNQKSSKNNVVQSLWIGESLPRLQQLSIQSFIDHGHEFHLYVYNDVSNIPKGTTLHDASRLIPQNRIFVYKSGFGKGSYSAFSNLFRYQLLYEIGGWWVDTDVVCLSRLQFDQPYVFSSEIDEDGSLLTASCAIKAPAQAECMRYCLDICATKDLDKLQWSEIGPYLLDDSIKRYGLERFQVTTEVFNPFNFMNFRQMIKPEFDMNQLKNSVATHFWNQMWKSYEIDLDSAPESSLYGQLVGRHLG